MTSKFSHSEIALGCGALLFVGLFATVPIAFILANSFNMASPGQPFRAGLNGWSEAFADHQTLRAAGYSFLLSIRSFAGAAIAFALSWLLIRVRIPGRAVIEFFLWVAFFLPTLPITLGWILLLDPNYGLLNQLFLKLPFVERAPFNIYSVGGIMWVHLTLTTVPVMTILLMPALRQFDAAIEESARVCGSGPWGILRRITLPLLAPALLTVTIAGLIRSLEAFEIEQLLGTPAGIDVYSTRIFEMISWEPPRFPAAMALSSFFLAILFILALFYQRYTQKREYVTVGARAVSLRPLMVGRWRYLASLLCLIGAGLCIILPMMMLVIGSFMRLYGFFFVRAPFSLQHWQSAFRDPLMLVCLKNSLVIAVGVAVAGLALYAFIAYVIVRTQVPARPTIGLLAWLPWAVPGVLLGVALLWLFLSLPGLSLAYGTFVPLILVLIIKEMPIGTHLMKAALAQISQELEEASWTCGAGRLTTFWRVSLPLVMPTLISIFAVVLIAALRDISTTILLVTAKTRPLAVLMLEYSRGGQLEVASIIGVMITTVAVVMALVARRVGLRMTIES